MPQCDGMARSIVLFWLLLAASASTGASCFPFKLSAYASINMDVYNEDGDRIPYFTVWLVSLPPNHGLRDASQVGEKYPYVMEMVSRYHRYLARPDWVVFNGYLGGISDGLGRLNGLKIYRGGLLSRTKYLGVFIVKDGYAPEYKQLKIGMFNTCVKLSAVLKRRPSKDLLPSWKGEVIDMVRYESYLIEKNVNKHTINDYRRLLALQAAIEEMAERDALEGRYMEASKLYWYRSAMPVVSLNLYGQVRSISRFESDMQGQGFLVSACRLSCDDQNLRFLSGEEEYFLSIREAGDNQDTKDNLAKGRSYSLGLQRYEADELMPRNLRGLSWWLGNESSIDRVCNYYKSLSDDFGWYSNISMLIDEYANLERKIRGRQVREGYSHCEIGDFQ